MLKDPLLVSLISLAAGSAITALITALRNKTAVLHYSSRSERVALSVEDAVFGAVRVTWQNQDVRNLYTVAIELSNNTVRDFEDIEFVSYTGNDTILLGEKTGIVGYPQIVAWSDDYKKRMAVPIGEAPTPEQWETYGHRREYSVPVLNRGDKLHFTYLCTTTGDEPPYVWMSSLCKGLKLRYLVLPVAPSFILDVPTNTASARGVLIWILTILACGFLIKSVWLALAISTVVGLAAQGIGALQYKIERFLRGMIAG